MVSTSISAALHGNASKETTISTQFLPPRSTDRDTRQHRQEYAYASLPSLTNASSANTNKDFQVPSRGKPLPRRGSGFYERLPEKENPMSSEAERPFESTTPVPKKTRDSIHATRATRGTTSVMATSANQKDPSRENRNFLGGINLTFCRDILLIPSPPTPSCAERLHQKRRLSMSFVSNKVATPLEDRTNICASPLVTNKTEHSSKGERNRKRRSLCHVPSPLETELEHPPQKSGQEMRNPPLPQHLVHDGIDEEHEARVERRSKIQCKRRKTLVLHPERVEAPLAPPLQERVVLEYEDEDCISSEQRRRAKRRQSLLLPSECSESLTIPTAAVTKNETNHYGINDKIEGTEDDVSNFAKLRILVRNYCSSKTSSGRHEECAIAIQYHTGYSLSLGNTVTPSDPKVIHTTRRALLTEIGPSVQLMEEKKVVQTREAVDLTGCTVEKTRNGRYKYRDAAGRRVTSDKYKLLYFEMIAKKKQEKADSFQGVRQRLEDHSYSNSISAVAQTSLQKAPNVEELRLSAAAAAAQVNTGCDNEDMDCDDSDVHFDRATPESKHGHRSLLCVHPGTNLKCEKDDNEDFLPLNLTNNSDCDLNEAMARGADEEGAIVETEDPVREGLKENLLPFLSRERESEDPEIAEAESKLWEAIDAALETYSREVIAIQTRKRAVRD